MSLLVSVLLRGTRASQPAAATVGEGSLYYVTDEGLIEQQIGGAWVAYSVDPSLFGSGTVTNTGGALTDHGVVVGNGGDDIAALSVGTNNTVLHGNTGADPSFSAVVEADITLADNTTNDVSTSKHGFVPKAPNDTTKFLRGDASWAVEGLEKLTGNRTYYVRTDGSDSNTGLVNDASGAFLTIQKAADVVSLLNIAGYTVTIQVGAGTYTGATVFCGPVNLGQQAGVPGTVHLLGDTTTPTNVVISTTSADALTFRGAGYWKLGGFKIQTTTSGHGIRTKEGAYVLISGAMNYGAVAGSASAHLEARSGSTIEITANYTISGAAGYHYLAGAGGAITTTGLTVTVSGTPAFAQQFILASGLARFSGSGMTFSGSATGTRYFCTYNAMIFTNSGGANYFPGNAAGSTSNGGIYV